MFGTLERSMSARGERGEWRAPNEEFLVDGFRSDLENYISRSRLAEYVGS